MVPLAIPVSFWCHRPHQLCSKDCCVNQNFTPRLLWATKAYLRGLPQATKTPWVAMGNRGFSHRVALDNPGFVARIAMGNPRLYCESCCGQPRFAMRVAAGNQGFAARVAMGNHGFAAGLQQSTDCCLQTVLLPLCCLGCHWQALAVWCPAGLRGSPAVCFLPSPCAVVMHCKQCGLCPDWSLTVCVAISCALAGP